MTKFKVRSQKIEARSQRSEARSKKSEVRSRTLEARSQKLKKSLLTTYHLPLTALLLLTAHYSLLTAASNGETFISLTRTAIDSKQLPTNTTTISHEEIQKSGAQNAGQALDKTAHVTIQRYSGLGSSYNAKIRGFLDKQIAIFVDNRRVPRSVSGPINLSQIPAESIDRIEIIRGAGSVLYGPDAEGGVIHIITKKAKGYIPTIQVGAFKQSYNTQIYQVNVGTKKERAEGYFTASKNRSDNYQENSDYDNTSFSGNCGYDFGTAGKTMLYFSYSKNQVGLPSGTTVPISEWDGEIERIPRDFFSRLSDINSDFQVEHVAQIKNFATLTARAAVTEMLRENLLTSTGPVTDRSRINRRSAYIQGDTPFGFTAGFEYIQEIIRSPFSIVPQTNGYGFFFQQKLSIKDLTIIPGVRFDNNTEWGDTTNPRLSLVYKPADPLKISANVGSAFQSPTFADLTDYNSKGKAISRLASSPPLSPENSWHYDVGIEVSPYEALTTKITLYRADIRDRLVSRRLSDGRYTTSNVQKGFNQGVEFEFDHALNRWFSQQFSYAYLQSEAKGDNFSSDFIELSYVPRNRIDYNAVFHLPFHVDFGHTFKYVGEQWTSENRRGMKLPDYFIWGMSINCEWKEIQLQFGVNNLLDSRYAERGGSGYAYPQPGRTFWGGMTVKFL